MKKLLLLTISLSFILTACTPPELLQSESTTEVKTTAPQKSMAVAGTPLEKYLLPLTADIVNDIDWILDSSYLDYTIVQEQAPANLRLKKIAEIIETMPLNEQYITMLQAFHQFNDAHTNFYINKLYYSNMPIIFEKIDQSFYIINATKDYRHLIGQHIVKIDNVDIATWYQRAYDIAASDNDYGRSRDAVDMLHMPLIYALYDNAVKHSLLFETDQTSQMVSLKKMIEADAFVSNNNNNLYIGSNTMQMFSAFVTDPYGYRIDKDHRIITIYFNRLGGIDSDELIAFGEEVRDIVLDRANYSVAFDFRTCLGGNIGTLPTIFEIDFLKSISNRAFSYVSRNSLSAGTTSPALFRRIGGIKIIGEMTPYSEHTSGVSSIADQYKIDSHGITVRISFSNGDYQKRLDQPAVIPDFLITPKLSDYLGESDSWQDVLIDNR